MEYFISRTAYMQIRHDKPGCLQDTSVAEYLDERQAERKEKAKAREQLISILRKEAKHYPPKRFGSQEELMRVMMVIIDQVCMEEMRAAVEYFYSRGINKTINYLLSCAE